MTHAEQRKILIDYLMMKAYQQDWHGVRDACVDIEVLEAKQGKKHDESKAR